MADAEDFLRTRLLLRNVLNTVEGRGVGDGRKKNTIKGLNSTWPEPIGNPYALTAPVLMLQLLLKPRRKLLRLESRHLTKIFTYHLHSNAMKGVLRLF